MIDFTERKNTRMQLMNGIIYHKNKYNGQNNALKFIFYALFKFNFI